MNLKDASLKNNICMIALIIILGFTAYSFMLEAPFKVMDDEISIINNEKIRDFKFIGDILGSSFFGQDTYYRPLVYLSFMLEYHFWGTNPFYYNLTNLFLHLLCALTVFFLIKTLLSNSMVGFLTALLFVIHPVHWEAVSNIPGRSILLCAFFVLNAFLFFIVAQKKKSAGIFYGLSILSFMLALLSKESAGMLPLVLLAYIFFSGNKNRGRQAVLVLPYFCVIAGYLFLRKSLGVTQTMPWRSLEEQVLGTATFFRGTLTFLRVFIAPFDLHFDRSRMLFTRFADVQLWLTISIYIIVTFLLIRFRKNISGLVFFLGIWFFLELFPVSQIITTIGVQPGVISLAEHFLYIASVGIFALLVLGGRGLYQKIKNKRTLKILFSSSVMGAFAFMFLTTVQQNIYASREIAMFQQTLRFAPHNVRIRNSLALALVPHGLFDMAEYHFRKVLEIHPIDGRARVGLGKALCDQGKYWEGIQVLFALRASFFREMLYS